MIKITEDMKRELFDEIDRHENQVVFRDEEGKLHMRYDALQFVHREDDHAMIMNGFWQNNMIFFIAIPPGESVNLHHLQGSVPVDERAFMN